MALIALFIWRPWDITWPVIWGERWGLGLLCVALGMVWKLRWRSRLFPVGMSYLLVSSVAAGFMMDYHPNIRGLSELTLGLKQASLAPLAVAMGFLCFLHLNVPLKKQLWWVALTILVAIAVSPHPKNMVYLMDNPTMAATTVVLASGLSLPMSIIAIILTHSCTAAFALGVGLTWWYRRHWQTWGIVAILLTSFTWYNHHRGYMPDNGRFLIWRETLNFWWKWNWSFEWFNLPMPPLHRFLVHWFGYGLGTTCIYFPLMRVAEAVVPSAMVSNWSHNDWLQVLSELGICGELCLVVCAARLFWLANTDQKARLLALYVSMFFNFPLHWLFSALVGWDLVREIALDDQIESTAPASSGTRKERAAQPGEVRRVRQGNTRLAQAARKAH